MNVVLYGASGMIGTRILDELTSRGHHVTAVVRDVSRVKTGPLVTAEKGDIYSSSDVASMVKGADAVISAYGPGVSGDPATVIEATKSLITGLTEAGVKRFIMIGGAASLFVAPGVTLLDSGHLPKEWTGIATAHKEALEILRPSDLEWTSLSPAAFIQPGERTGKFRLGQDDLIVDDKGVSRISAEDFAIALVDELETPKHIRQRFTAAY